MKRFPLFFLTFLLVSGCAQLEQKQPAITDEVKFALWQEHQLSVNTINAWRVKGRLSVKTPEDSGTVVVNWVQEGGEYELRLIAPLGQGTYTLKGHPEGVILQGPDNKILTADTAEQLLSEGLGWSVHINGLKYWIRGLPEPDVSYSGLELDNQGRLINMYQSGFDVNIKRYVDKGAYALPEKIFIKGDTIQLKMIIQTWET